MKRILPVVLVLSLIITAFAPQPVEGLLPTRLKVTVIDELGNVQEGAVVKLYLSEEDYRKETNETAGPEVTDKKGVVKFNDLKPQQYYIYVEKGEMRNDGAGVLTAPLEEGKMNKVNVVIY